MRRTLLDAWKAWAIADARRRGLPALEPIIEGLAASTARLRATAWIPAADSPSPSASAQQISPLAPAQRVPRRGKHGR